MSHQNTSIADMTAKVEAYRIDRQAYLAALTGDPEIQRRIAEEKMRLAFARLGEKAYWKARSGSLLKWYDHLLIWGLAAAGAVTFYFLSFLLTGCAYQPTPAILEARRVPERAHATGYFEPAPAVVSVVNPTYQPLVNPQAPVQPFLYQLDRNTLWQP
jgi:hypothetical protein